MNRRNFLKVVGVGATVVAVEPSLIRNELRAEDGQLYKAYEKVQLVGKDGTPIKASALLKEKNYVFNYPYRGTSSILLNLEENVQKEVRLKDEEGVEYIFKGGIGKDGNIVAYNSICPHQLTHVNKEDSFISYIPKNKKTMAYKEGGIIVCGSHLSAYDVKKGAAVLAGPAPQPLPTIVLEYADDDTIWAVGVLGHDKFHDYFKSFKPEFKEQFGGKRKAKKLTSDSALTMLLSEYTQEIISY